MKNIYKIVFLCLFVLFSFEGKAQDIHYSHANFSPLYTNPSFTGYFDGNLRAYANYRNQYYSFVNSASFQTVTGSVDFNIPVGTMGRDFVGVGLYSYYDRGGTNRIGMTNVTLTGAYNKALAPKGKHAISVGAAITYSQRFINLRGISFGDQFDQELGIASLSTGEVLPDNTYANLDISLGGMYFTAFSSKANLYAGITVAHIAKPQFSFYGFSDERLPTRFGVQVGSNIRTGKKMELTPLLYYQYQNKISEVILGSMMDYRIIDFIGSETDVLLGLYARTLHSPNKPFVFESMIILLGIEYTKMRLAFSYDANFSALRSVTKSNSAFEVSLMYTLGFLKGRSVTRYCPKM